MKSKQIYVGINGATLALTKSRGVAVFPPQKGGANASHVLTDSGRLARVPGARWNGVGVPRFLTENGFELAAPGDELATRLADMLDVEDGRSLVQAASKTQAEKLQRTLAGKSCTFVPFDESKPCVTVKVEESDGSRILSVDLASGFASAAIKIEHFPGSALGWEVALDSGWLVGPNDDADSMPRNTEYGGLVEQAVYVICNCGLGSLVGEHNLVADSKSSYPRGLMKFALASGDIVQVGIAGCDDLVVHYIREGEVQYLRRGMFHPRLGDVIGAIAAVMVRVGEMDASKTKKALKKAA